MPELEKLERDLQRYYLAIMFTEIARNGLEAAMTAQKTMENINEEEETYFLEEILEEYVNLGYVHQIEDDYADNYFIITHKGIQFFREELRSDESLCYKYNRLGHPWAFSALERIWEGIENIRKAENIEDGSDDNNAQIPPGDAGWEPLPLDRDTGSYEVARKHIKEAIDIIERDNGYSANEPVERDQIVATLKTGAEILDSNRANTTLVEALLLRPFKYLASKFSDSAIGVAAKAAVSAIIAWLT